MELSEYKLKTLKMIYDGLTDPIDPNMQALFLEAKLVVAGKGIYPLEVTDAGINELVENELLKDLFEHYQDLPKELGAVCAKWNERASNGLQYTELAEWRAQVEAIGYTFDYYLDAEPYNLVKSPATGELNASDYAGMARVFEQGAMIRQGLLAKALAEQDIDLAKEHEQTAANFERWGVALRVSEKGINNG